WRASGAERAWDAVIDFEFDLGVALTQWRGVPDDDVDAPADRSADDWAAVLAAVYGDDFEEPRETLGRLIAADHAGAAELYAEWREQRRSGNTVYDERGYWRARGVLTRPARARRVNPRRRGSGRPGVRRAVRAHAPPGDDDGPAEPAEHDLDAALLAA